MENATNSIDYNVEFIKSRDKHVHTYCLDACNAS